MQGSEVAHFNRDCGLPGIFQFKPAFDDVVLWRKAIAQRNKEILDGVFLSDEQRFA